MTISGGDPTGQVISNQDPDQSPIGQVLTNLDPDPDHNNLDSVSYPQHCPRPINYRSEH